jgi:hypothetical protein|tara:strand:- start:179 stop:355 length:177 start_codon:yes stop_codon:yes gene_type:complete
MSDNREENRTVFTKEELWLSQAPNFNFELDGDQLLEKALASKFVTKIGEDQYLVNNNY